MKKVLLAEDDETIRTLVTRLLESMGWEVTAVENGQLALNTIDGNVFKFCVIDLEMPVMSGLAFIQHLRCSQYNINSIIPVIVITAHADRDVQCKSVGVNKVLLKPIRKVVLESAIKEVLK